MIGLFSGIMPAWRAGAGLGRRRYCERWSEAVVPIKYNIRSLRARWVSSLMTVLGTGWWCGRRCWRLDWPTD